jgi:hypothetical protein
MDYHIDTKFTYGVQNDPIIDFMINKDSIK